MNRTWSTVLIIGVMLALILSVPFILTLLPAPLVDTYGVTLVLIPVGIIVVLIGIIFVATNKNTKGNAEEQQRTVLLAELKEAEKQYLKHQIDKVTFDSISREKNAALIKVEAAIDGQKKQVFAKKEAKQLDTISSDKKRVLSGLLDQKQKKVHELKLSEQSYLKRKIDEAAYINISAEIKKELVSIDAQINSLQKADEIEKIEEQLKEGAREIAHQKKTTKDRGLGGELEEEVIDQLHLSR